MLEQISWGNYIAATGTVLLCYYTAVAAICYRSEIRGLLQRGNTATGTEVMEADPESPTADDNSAFEGLEVKVSEINSVLHKAGKGVEKPELLRQLRAVTTNYDGLGKPAFRAAVFNHIIRQAEDICGVRISVEELEG